MRTAETTGSLFIRDIFQKSQKLVLTKSMVDKAVAHKVSHILVGELKGIRQDKDWGAQQNQELHAWPYRKIIEMLTYKAALKGIRVQEVSERNISTTCPICGERVKSARVERGLFVHCGEAMNADVVGAFNILQRYLRDNELPLLEVVGTLARRWSTCLCGEKPH